jgi:hypothetical protein
MTPCTVSLRTPIIGKIYANKEGKGGRPNFDEVLMISMLVLQHSSHLVVEGPYDKLLLLYSLLLIGKTWV